MESKYLEEERFLKAKKRVKEIKAFYVHLIVHICSLSVIITINLIFVPQFHFFWFAAGGMFLALFFHWLGVFGFKNFGLGKEWEEKKIKELMQQDKNGF
ncbi:MAG: 2TM domain-containing protein [Flavobacteriaceae bacterium]